MARTKPAEQRRSELLDAAEQLFAQKGIAAVTVEDYQAAGVSKGTFYSYFRAREDVLEALRARYVESLLDAQNEAMSRLHPDDWAGRIETWLVAGIRIYLQDPDKHNTLFHLPHGSAGDDAGGEEVGYGHVEVLTSLLTAGRDAGALRVADPESTAVLLYGSIHHNSTAAKGGEGPLMTAAGCSPLCSPVDVIVVLDKREVEHDVWDVHVDAGCEGFVGVLVTPSQIVGSFAAVVDAGAGGPYLVEVIVGSESAEEVYRLGCVTVTAHDSLEQRDDLVGLVASIGEYVSRVGAEDPWCDVAYLVEAGVRADHVLVELENVE